MLHDDERDETIDGEDERPEVVQALVDLAQTDGLYADRYMERADALLSALLSRGAYEIARRSRDDLPRLTQRLREATGRGDWQYVRELAEAAGDEQREVDKQGRLLAVADAVYGPRVFRPTPTAMAMSGLITRPASELHAARQRMINALDFLCDADPPAEPFYGSRLTYFERLESVPERAVEPVVDADGVRRRILSAVERHDFVEVRRLTERITGARADGTARMRIAPAAPETAQTLSHPIPASAAERGGDLGLAPTTLPLLPALNDYLGCCCGEAPLLPSNHLSDATRHSEACTCGHACPPALSATLRQTFDLLLLHPFITSAGTRYLPWFGRETLLVETFSETAPDARTPLLERLGIPKRQGISRMQLEHAVRSHGATLCADLGLDPVEFVIAAIPFDAYLRLAPTFGWGTQQMWTHFDGYQVTRDLGLRALIGGDTRFGGAEDLCAVQPDYDAETLTARFCVLRRCRFVVRAAAATPAAHPGGEA